MKCVKGFLSLSHDERKILIRLLLYIIRAEIILSFLPYGAVRKLVFLRNPLNIPSPDNAVNILRCHLRLLIKLCGNFPLNVSCLRKAVALRDSLAAYGIEAKIKFGLGYHHGNLGAHAWLECCGYEILKNGIYSQFVPINGGSNE